MMQKIDAEHLDHPAKGVVGMTDFLLEEGYKVGLRKVRRMMCLMGIMPVCHHKHLSKLGSASYIKPYLLGTWMLTIAIRSGALILHTFR